MADWVAKLGFIVPSWNTVMEYECQRLAPPGVSNHFTRIDHTDDSEPRLLHMVEEVPELSRLLGHAKLNAICFACTGGSFIREGADREIIGRVEAAASVPGTTSSTALAEALRTLGVRRVAIASPYSERSNERLAKFLEGHGIAVVRKRGLNVECPAFLPPETAAGLAREVDGRDAEGILISCTNFRTLEAIEGLEEELGKPVVSSVTASFWHTLRLAGVRGPVSGGGRLLASH